MIAASLLLGCFLASLEIAVVMAVLPQIAEELGGAGLLPWAITGPLAATTLCTPLAGALGDRYGRKRVWIGGVLLLLAGSAWAAVAPTMEAFLAARVLQGVGGAALMPVTIALCGDLFEVRRRAQMFGAISLVWGVSTLIGPFLGAAVTEAWSWRAIFWAHLPPGLLAVAGVAWALPAGAGRSERQGEAGWTALLGIPEQRIVLIVGPAITATFHGVIGYLPAFVQGVEGGGPMEAGLALLPISLAWSASSNLVGWVLPRFGVRGMLQIGGGLLLAGCGLGSGLAVPGWLMARWALLMVGLGMGFLFSTLNIAAQERAPAELKGTATSLSIFTRNLGATVAVPLWGALAGFAPEAERLADIPDLAGGIARVMAASTASAALVLLIGRRYPEGKGEAVEVGAPGVGH